MRSPQALQVGLAFAIALAGCSSSNTRSDAGAFVAAPWPPPDLCGVLAFADFQTPAPAGGYHPDPVDNGSMWMAGCDWEDSTTTPAHQIQLTLTGALTPEENASFGVYVTNPGGADAGVETVSGLGTAAFYLNQSGVSQTLVVWFKSYLLRVWVSGYTPDVPEASLQPLALKVMGQL
jgi:hypothetical protein